MNTINTLKNNLFSALENSQNPQQKIVVWENTLEIWIDEIFNPETLEIEKCLRLEDFGTGTLSSLCDDELAEILKRAISKIK